MSGQTGTGGPTTGGPFAGGGVNLTAFITPAYFGPTVGCVIVTGTDRVRFRGVETDTVTATMKMRKLTGYFIGTSGYKSSTQISTQNFGTYAANFTLADGHLEPGHFGGGSTGQITDNNQITYQWAENSDCPGLGTLC